MASKKPFLLNFVEQTPVLKHELPPYIPDLQTRVRIKYSAGDTERSRSYDNSTTGGTLITPNTDMDDEWITRPD